MLIWKNDEAVTVKAVAPAPKKKQKSTAKAAQKEPDIALPDADPAKAVKK